jgi:hypothetical protein
VDAILPVLIAAGIGLLGWASWFLARRFGVWPGMILPALATGLAALRASMPPGHAEEAMGRGLELVFLWGPLVLLSVLAALGGLVMRQRERRRG